MRPSAPAARYQDAFAPARSPDPHFAPNSKANGAEVVASLTGLKGQPHVKRALEVAAAGGHNVVMVGPPGSGKTMLAMRVPTILPALSTEEALEVTKIYSISGSLPKGVGLMTKRPFRPPHHTISAAGLAGGGAIPRPGEVSLAHFGVLFLDELPEFSRDVLEVLRGPLEDGSVNVARVAGSATFPARAMLVAALNPCPCGYFMDSTRHCTCGTAKIRNYLQRVSGPLLDRIDIHIEVPRLPKDDMLTNLDGEGSRPIRARVQAARQRQSERFAGTDLHCNAHMGPRHLKKHCPLHEDVRNFLSGAIDQLGLSARAFDRIVKLSRTIADLEGVDDIAMNHVAEAVQYRGLDRKLWQ